MENKASWLFGLANLVRSLFWIFFIFIIVFQWAGSASLEKKRIEAIESIQNERGIRVITLIHREETVILLEKRLPKQKAGGIIGFALHRSIYT